MSNNIHDTKVDKIKAQVFDVLGKPVLNEFVMNRRLNVSSLNTGIYIIKLKQGTTTTTKKLIVQ